MMKGTYKSGLTEGRYLMLAAAAALIGCSVYLFSLSGGAAAAGRKRHVHIGGTT